MVSLLLLLACGAPAYEDVPARLVGVGYDPDEIGPTPTPYGGVAEYGWVEFAGGGLSFAHLGLGGLEEVGPGLAGFAPPYAAVYGSARLFAQPFAGADILAGVTAVPPARENSCYTSLDARGALASHGTVDVGSWMEFTTVGPDGEPTDGGLRFERVPADYPPDPEGVSVAYAALEPHAADARYARIADAGTGNRAEDLGTTLVGRRNFPFGESVELRAPGALVGVEVPVASLPRPVRGTRLLLPKAPGAVQMEWVGPRYGAYGEDVSAGAIQTCLTYTTPANSPEGPADCEALPTTGDVAPQIYTGPWDTEDGELTFRWRAGSASDGYVSLSVRFLGPVDRADPRFAERVVLVDPDERATSVWEGTAGVPAGTACPTGRRSPTACEPGGETVFDDAWLTAAGELVPALRGDPAYAMAEVTCRLKDTGSYTLTAAQLEEALVYARAHEAEGAIFSFARSADVDATVPPARDAYDQRLDVSPVKLTSRAVVVGRFWYEE